MPRLGGLALVEALRADTRTAAVPVLLLSARAGEEASVEGLQAGADDYLVKPYSPQELSESVAARIERAERMRGTQSVANATHAGKTSTPPGTSTRTATTWASARHWTSTPFSKESESWDCSASSSAWAC